MDQLDTNGGTSTASVPPASAATDLDAVYEEKISKLAKLTQRGTIKWHTVDASSIPTLSFARVLTAYEATFGGENLRLLETGYEKREPFLPKTNEMGSIALSLHLLDQNDRPTFRFPSVKAIYALLGEVKAQQSDIAGFLDAIDVAAEKELS